MNTKAKGEKTEGVILAALLKAGKTVLMPFGDNQRYDLVIDEGNGTFTRLQCKTARILKGTMVFATASTYAHRGGKRKGYHGQADIFAVWCPSIDKIYMVPVSEAGASDCYLRIEPLGEKFPKWLLPKVKMAEKYEFK